MQVLVIQHVESEGPGSLGDYLRDASVDMRSVRLYAGDRLSAADLRCDAVVSMGGPMNVYEEDRYPFLREEVRFLEDAVDRGLPVLGVCLGAQMIARACGAKVVRSPDREVGWGEVFLTREGCEDRVFQGLPPTFRVLQWHEDMFELPPSAVLLARGEACPHQAFRVRHAVGLQFHVEATGEMVADWFRGRPDGDAIVSEHRRCRASLERNARVLYENFFDSAAAWKIHRVPFTA